MKVNGHSEESAEATPAAVEESEKEPESEKEVEFTWTGEAASVSVRGDFNNWEELTLAKR